MAKIGSFYAMVLPHFMCYFAEIENLNVEEITNSFSAIKLPAAVMSGLYKGHLVGQEKTESAPPLPTTPQPVANETIKPAPLRYLGENTSHIILLVQYPGSPYLPDEQLEFLTRMLGACKKNMGDVAIVNTASQMVSIENLRKELAPVQVILFGVEPAGINLPVNFPSFKLQMIDGITFLKAPALDIMNQDGAESKNLKGQLWNCLRQLFGI